MSPAANKHFDFVYGGQVLHDVVLIVSTVHAPVLAGPSVMLPVVVPVPVFVPTVSEHAHLQRAGETKWRMTEGNDGNMVNVCR